MTPNRAFQTQLPLLDDAPRQVGSLRERLAAITWSYSRRSTLDQCARRYFYEYYGANLRTARDLADKQDLHFLKGVATRHERAGSIVHLVIAWYLRETQKGAEPGAERALSWARRLFEADRTFSCAHPGEREIDPSTRFPPVLLREYHYRDPRAEALCEETEVRMLDALTAFATDGAFAAFRLAAAGPETLVEATVRLGNQVTCRVDGKVDLAFRRGPAVMVVDWKMGAGDGTGDDSLQLAVYAIWAMSHFGCDMADVQPCKAHLGSREVVYFHADAAVLAAARARVIQDAELMLTLHEYGEAGVAEAFSPCLIPAVCNGCSFQRACPEGRQLARA